MSQVESMKKLEVARLLEIEGYDLIAASELQRKREYTPQEMSNAAIKNLEIFQDFS